MTTYTWPTMAAKPELWPRSMEWRKVPNTLASASPLTQSLYTLGRVGDRWGVSVVFKANQTYAQRAKVEAFLFKLNGPEHQVLLFDFARSVPSGTINLTGVTASAASQFAESIVLNGCGNTKTLLEGDWFSVVTSNSTQLLMATADCTSSTGGVMTVPFTARLRGSVSAGAAVVLSAPTAKFILEPGTEIISPRDPQGVCPEFGVNFIEFF